MGTRSAVGIAQGDGWKARYVHWDGYPTGVGLEIFAIHRLTAGSDWKETVRLLTKKHFSWSVLDPGQEPGEGQEPGVGRYHTDAEEDDWILSDGDNWGAEWAYILTEHGVTVLEARRDGMHAMGMFGVNPGAAWTHRASIPWDAADYEQRLVDIEKTDA